MNINNFFLNTDSYKLSHFKMYPKNTEKMYFYIESRGGRFENQIFFGLQYWIKNLQNNFPTMNDVEEANELSKAHGVPFNYEGAKKLVEKGHFPIRIKAVPEGTVINYKNVMVTVETTDPEFYWLASYLETSLLRDIWFGTAVATYSYQCKKVIEQYLEETNDNKETLPIKLHDFGSRGVSTHEGCGVAGMAHLVNFIGTDNLTSISFADKYYNSGVCGITIPAAEHSTICAYGKDHEQKAYENIMNKYPTGLLSIVSDTYDLDNAVRNIFGENLKDQILSRDGTVVIRPDSGEPSEIVPKVLNILWEKFGGEHNTKGYAVLNDKVRVIQGDGVSYESIGEILEAVKQAGFSTDNLALGMGGQLLQAHNRDDLKFAMKCSNLEIDGQSIDVYKDPATDSSKRSKKGRLALIENGNGSFSTVAEDYTTGDMNVLRTVYEDGKLQVDDDFETVRSRQNR
ncbi:hypothetical protein PBI_SCTP2_104 [Salicola phage SCTP-2]|nr:hypothetical protein PBI_SCTP2_104 [Salicola phage SCTP-2]